MATETRTFQSVDQSPEAIAANAAYFAEQGVSHAASVEGVDVVATPPAAPAASVAAPGTEAATEAEVDAETAAEWESDQTDGKRLSRQAKKRKEARDQKVEIDRLKAELAARPAAPATPATPAASEPPAASAAGAIATEAFAEVEPAEPKYEDYAAEEDQLLAYNRALAKHGRDWSRWDRKREAHDTKVEADKARQTEQATTARNTRLEQLNQRLAEVRVELPDFDAVLKNGAELSPALSAASTVVPGGLKAAYQLMKDPAKLKQFNELTAETQKVQGRDVPTQGAYDLALYLLGQATNLSGAPPASAATPPAAAIPSTAVQPREESPAIPPARGRAAATPTRSDLSGDARRDALARESS